MGPLGRAAAHAAAGPRGAAHPRQEGPVDLRLAGPAVAAWGTAAVTLPAPPAVGGAVAVAGLVAALVLLRARGGLRASATRAGPRTTVAAVLLCAAGAAASAGLHGAQLRSGPVPALAAREAVVTAEVRLTSDPRLARPRVTGNRPMTPTVLVDAEIRRLDGPAGETTLRTPVLLLADPGEARARWLALLPSTRLAVTGRLAPARSGGDRFAAVLKSRGGRAPRVVAGPTGAQRTAGRLRAGLREATDGLEPDARALLPGLVVGDTSRITPELDHAFQETDLAHILAVSGSNLTILLALLLGPPGLAQRAERRGLAPRLGLTLRTTALLGGALTLGFVVVCRPDPSVLRAAACGTVVLLALATGRRRAMVPALAAAVLLLVLYDPWLARSPGFLLSVLATGSLLLLAPRWSEALRRRRVPPRLAEALGAAAAAQAVCAPVVVVFSGRVSLVAIPCNLLTEFAIAPATVLGFAALLTAPLAIPVAEVLARCAGWPAGWVVDVARAGAGLPGAGVDWPEGWGGAALLAVTTLAVLPVLRRLPGRPLLCAGLGLLLAVAVLRPPQVTRLITGWPPPHWRMVVCDVGQGDALVLDAGPGSAVVIDTGPEPEPVDRCLRTLGVRRVPLVVLTHFHADHVAGLPGVLRGRSVAEIAATGHADPVDQAAFVHRTAAAARVPVTRAVAGQERRVGDGLRWRVLWPEAAGIAALSPNDASVALLVRTAGLRLLLLGDLEPPGQRALAASPLLDRLGPVDVLKVAHHGSAHQDAELTRRLAPRLAVISCGHDNVYGHPAPSTVAALRARGAEVRRTDRDGAVAVTGARGSLGVVTAGPG
ncbi:ComEC/Rec2 family competence protein [Streptomyces abyssomicinicus]|uniref:ComEC/Rec2 family competence protein n=1 Tax=Streptomyces abyssomicinicus TaxID=574929 RepID=UPI001FEB55AA|nr:ComEC/Rec2 family competence protein [Streptomyces abyssomicinicus]